MSLGQVRLGKVYKPESSVLHFRVICPFFLSRKNDSIFWNSQKQHLSGKKDKTSKQTATITRNKKIRHYRNIFVQTVSWRLR